MKITRDNVLAQRISHCFMIPNKRINRREKNKISPKVRNAYFRLKKKTHRLCKNIYSNNSYKYDIKKSLTCM